MKKDEKYVEICKSLKALEEALEDFMNHMFEDSREGSCDEYTDRKSAERCNYLESILREVEAGEGVPESNISFDDVVSSRDVWEERWHGYYYKPEDEAYKLCEKHEHDDYETFLSEDHDRALEAYERVAKEVNEFIHKCQLFGFDYNSIDEEEDDND